MAFIAAWYFWNDVYSFGYSCWLLRVNTFKLPSHHIHTWVSAPPPSPLYFCSLSIMTVVYRRCSAQSLFALRKQLAWWATVLQLCWEWVSPCVWTVKGSRRRSRSSRLMLGLGFGQTRCLEKLSLINPWSLMSQIKAGTNVFFVSDILIWVGCWASRPTTQRHDGGCFGFFFFVFFSPQSFLPHFKPLAAPRYIYCLGTQLTYTYEYVYIH